MTGRRKELGHRAVLSLADQAVASVSNVAVVLAVAHDSSAADTGAFSLAYLVLTFALVLTRVGVGDAALVTAGRSRSLGTAAFDPRWSSRLFSAFVAAGCAAGVGLAALATVSTHGRTLILALAVGAPACFGVEALRHLFFARAWYGRALLIDFLWLSGLVVLWLVAPFGAQPAALVAYWSASAAVLALAGRLYVRPIHGPRGTAGFVRTLWPLSRGLLADLLVARGSTQVINWSLAGILGVAAVAGLRVADVLLGPINTLLHAGQTFALAELSRKKSPWRATELTAILGVGLILGGVTLAMCLAIYLAPSAWMSWLLGESAALVMSVLWPLALVKALLAVTMAAVVLLRAAARPGPAARVRAVGSAVQIGASLGLAVPFGLVGAAWGIAAGSAVISAGMWWAVWRYWRLSRFGDEPHRSVDRTRRSKRMQQRPAAITPAGPHPPS